MTRRTKTATRELLRPLWFIISRSDKSAAGLDLFGGRVTVERVYHRGRTGPAWTPSWEFKRADIRHGLQSDSMSTFIDQLHRWALPSDSAP